MEAHHILLVDDDPSLSRVIQFQLEEAGYHVSRAASGEEGLRSFKEHNPGLVITDIKMPRMDGLALLAEIKRLSPHALVIVITAHGSIDTAITAMKTGAHDYLCKPFAKDELLVTVEKALAFQGLMRENVHLQEALLQRFRFDNIVGGSEAMERVFHIVRRVSRADSSVLLEGESGTGKELIAQAIHYNSPRQKKPFIAVNCAAIPEHLMESEFFGHVKGAFTGAIQDRTGKFELAQGGTIFLDEIADMRLDLQGKLLRVLQEKEIDKVGSRVPLPADVRVIAATNKNLKQQMEEGRFREDLYYRLSVVPIRIPPLRERLEDIPLLIQYFLREFGGGRLSADREVYEVLKDYHWPGNVRELRNVIEQAVVLRQREDRIHVSDLPDHIRSTRSEINALGIEIPPQGIVLEELEKELIAAALRKAGGNQIQAAKLLGITRQTLIYRMKKYGLS